MLPDQWDLTSRDFIENRESMIVNNYAQYCSVVKTGIGKAKMIIGGEVDAGMALIHAKVQYSLLKPPQFGTASPRTRTSLSIGLN